MLTILDIITAEKEKKPITLHKVVQQLFLEFLRLVNITDAYINIWMNII